MGSVQTKAMTADNIAAVFTLATASERAIHATWYDDARSAIAIADATGLNLEHVVGVIAAYLQTIGGSATWWTLRTFAGPLLLILSLLPVLKFAPTAKC